MLNFVSTLFGTPSTRFLKEAQPYIPKINALEAEFQAKSDTQLAAVTDDLKARLVAGAKLESLIPEAFAAVREAARRALGLRAFDVQLIGGLTLHFGKIAEMKTGEGKTLVATFASYLNALSGKGVHVVTVNDYLAKRDAAWMGQVFTKLGLTTAAIYHGQSPEERKAAYQADITYATNNELGFDYLRDHMVLSPLQLVQRPLHYAIVDEVDSILIDEARTPLIISGPSDDKTELYQILNTLIPDLIEGEDYELDEKQRSANLTEEGTDKTEAFLRASGLLEEEGNLYDVHNISLVHHVGQALRAHTLFKRDAEYIVRKNPENGQDEVVLIDEFTGRMMPGRRLSDGLHQAIEAKEGVDIKQENQTLASITFQNYFRLYEKLSGMTGTAATEAEEFENIYNLPVIAIPTNNPVARIDFADIIYASRTGKLAAIVKDIEDCHKRGQPVLVGTTTIERSEELSEMLKRKKVPHQVLNARYHEQEAAIIAQAGRKGAVTIATNMAGRGTDIKLGGNIDLLLEEAGETADEASIRAMHKQEHEEVIAAGGLKVLGTERHESRRIDNQLRGRSGRQGDVGTSVFYLSLQDELLKRFAAGFFESMINRLQLPEDEAIQIGMISKRIEVIQNRIEAFNFDIRKNILKYDEILNDQRKVVYDQRMEILFAENLEETLAEFRAEILDALIAQAFPPNALPEQWKPEILIEGLQRTFNLNLPVNDWLKDADVGAGSVAENCRKAVEKAWSDRTSAFTPEVLGSIEKSVLLQTLDKLWRHHLQALDILRKGIGLRGYAQKDPLNEYAKESFMLFADLLAATKQETISTISRVQLVNESEAEAQIAAENARRAAMPLEVSHPTEQGPVTETVAPQNGQALTPTTFGVESWDDLNPLDARIPRNAPCPCGSGERFKQCHGSLDRLRAKAKQAA